MKLLWIRNTSFQNNNFPLCIALMYFIPKQFTIRFCSMSTRTWFIPMYVWYQHFFSLRPNKFCFHIYLITHLSRTPIRINEALIYITFKCNSFSFLIFSVLYFCTDNLILHRKLIWKWFIGLQINKTEKRKYFIHGINRFCGKLSDVGSSYIFYIRTYITVFTS